MKYLRIVLASLMRKKVRLVLTLGSFAVALFLFGVLATVHTAFSRGVELAGADRLAVINKISLIMPLPISYRDRIAQIPDVSAVSFATWFGGVYQDPNNFFPQFAVDSESWRLMYPEYVVSESEWQDYLNDRQGAVVGRATARRFGWKIGDRIPIQGTIWQGNWEFNLRAIYDGARPGDDETQFWFQYEYLDEQRPFYKGMVGWYVVQVAHPDRAAAVARAIDERFANSPYETRAQTEKAFAASFVNAMGNVELILVSIGSVVFFTLLLVTGNTMAIAVRERTSELAVLKAVGFSDRLVLALVLAEALLLALVGGGIGLALAKLFTLGGDPTGGMLGAFQLPLDVIGVGFALTLLVGATAGLLPAVSAMRLRVVDALRRV